MRHLLALAIVSVAAIPSTGMARTTCSTQMYDRADASLENATGSWHALQKHQRIFASCDDGALAEGYSDAVVKLLANHWERFPVFAALSQRDPAFRRWAIRHIDSSAASDDLKRVVRHAATCIHQVQAKLLCASLDRAANAALKR
jgi:hypothetical protein